MSDMSGHVVKLNDDEEDEDNDDTGGLLSHDDSDDDFADLRHQNKSRGRSVLKRLRVGGDKGLVPYPAMRSGTVMQLLNTLTICCIFFGMVRKSHFSIWRYRIFFSLQSLRNKSVLDKSL